MIFSHASSSSFVLAVALGLLASSACSPAAPEPDPGDGNGNGNGDGDGNLGDGGSSSGGSSATGGANGTGGTTLGSGGATTGGNGGSMNSSGGAQNGTGGGAATGGAGATGGSPGTGGSTPLGSGCESADIFCLDFNADTVGSLPSGDWDSSVMCYDSNYSRAVEAGVGLESSQAFVTSGASPSANTCALVHDLGALSDFWVTAHIKISGTTPDMEHEVTFFELGEFANVDDPELRIGYRGDSSCPNAGASYQGFELGATKGLSNGEDTGCTGSKTNDGIPVADEWYCIEVHVTQGNNMLMADMWVNGENQDFLQHSQPVTEIGGAFEAHYLKVGQQSYTGSFAELIIDNVSLSTSQVGCAL